MMRMGVYIQKMVKKNPSLVSGVPHRRHRRAVIFTRKNGTRFAHRAPKFVLPWGKAPW